MAKLSRTLGLPLLTFYGTGMILGAGIYSVIGKAAGESQNSLWMSFVLAAVAVFFTALSYAELASMLPKSGSEFIFLKTAFPKFAWIALAVGLMVIFSGVATASTVAIAFSGYLNTFLKVPVFVIALSLIAVFTVVNIIGIHMSSGLNVVFTLIEISGLILFIYLGVQTHRFTESFQSTPSMGTLSAAALVIFAFFGFENIANLIEEAKQPTRDVPRAILISLGVTTTLYLLVSFAAIALMDPAQLADSSAPLADAARKSSPKGASALSGIALFATANTALISLLTTSRFLYRMSKEKALPHILSKISEKGKSPWVSSICVGILATILLPIGNVEIVASISSFAALLSFFAVNIALIVLRFTEKNMKRPFKVPLNIGRVPLLPILGAVFSLLFITQFRAQVYFIGVGFLVLGLLVAKWRWSK